MNMRSAAGPAAEATRAPEDRSPSRARTRRRPSIKIFSSAADATRSRRPTDGLLLAFADPRRCPPVVPGAGADRPRHRDHQARGPAAGARRVVLGGGLRPPRHLGAVPAAACVVRATGGSACSSTSWSRWRLGSGARSSSARSAARTRRRACPASSTRRRRPIYVATRIAIATAVIVTASPDLARPMRQIGRALIADRRRCGDRARGRAPDRGRRGVPDRVRCGRPGAPPLRLPRRASHARSGDGGAPRARGRGDGDARRSPPAARGGPHPRDLDRWAAAPGQDLRTRRRGRSVRRRDVVRDLAPGREAVRAGRLEQVEHEAFLTLAAERGGVRRDAGDGGRRGRPGRRAPRAGCERTPARFARRRRGRSTSSSAVAGMPSSASTSWASRTDASDARSVDRAAGRVGGAHRLRRRAGRRARRCLRTDRAQLLVTAALATDTDRAVAAASDVLGDDGLAEVLPFLQPAAFEYDTRKAMHDQHLDLKALREDDRRPHGHRGPAARADAARHLAFAREARRDRVPGLHADLRLRRHRHRHHRRGVQARRLVVAAGRAHPVAALAGPAGVLDDGGDDAGDPVHGRSSCSSTGSSSSGSRSRARRPAWRSRSGSGSASACRAPARSRSVRSTASARS